MKFCVCRTSSCNPCSENQPCEGAIKELIDSVDVWTIEINSIDELMELIKKNGRSIVSSETRFFHNRLWHEIKYPCIEIYDDYRE